MLLFFSLSRSSWRGFYCHLGLLNMIILRTCMSYHGNMRAMARFLQDRSQDCSKILVAKILPIYPWRVNMSKNRTLFSKSRIESMFETAVNDRSFYQAIRRKLGPFRPLAVVCKANHYFMNMYIIVISRATAICPLFFKRIFSVNSPHQFNSPPQLSGQVKLSLN